MGLVLRLAGPLRALAASPRWATFTGALSRVAGVTLRTVDEIVLWVKNNKGASLLLVSALTEAGVSVVDFFRAGKPKLDPEDKEHVRELSQLANNSYLRDLLSTVIAADGDKLAAKTDEDERKKRDLSRVVVAWAREAFGGSVAGTVNQNVMSAHAALQLFAAIPAAQVASMLSDPLAPLPVFSTNLHSLLRS